MIVFDSSVSATEYLKLARSEPDFPSDLVAMVGPSFEFGLNRVALHQLVTGRGWRGRPPRVRLVAEWNTRGNIRVAAHALDTSEFEGVGSFELLWFRRFRRILNQAQRGNQAAVYLVYGHIARYAEVLSTIRQRLEVVHAPRIQPFWEFNIDIVDREPSG